MKYDSIQELKKDFVDGKIKHLSDILHVNGIEYHIGSGNVYPFDEIIGGENKPMIVYVLHPSDENKEAFDKLHTTADDNNSVQDRVVFVWAVVRLNVRPVEVKFVAKQRLGQVMVREAEIADERIIKHKIAIVLGGFNGGNTINAKVDTGAAICSLDANNVNINDERGERIVTFSFGDRKVTMPLVDTQAVKTADGGVENRPVVAFDVSIPNEDATKQNRVIKKVEFNLNDRSGMPDKILLGQNFIKAGDFVVMDKPDESKVIESNEIDWGLLQMMFRDIEIPNDNRVSINEVEQALLSIFKG